MSVLDRLVSHLAPHDCLGCGTEGSLLCSICAGRLSATVPSCYRCRTPSIDFLTCESCQSSSWLHRVRSVTLYDGLAKDLIWKLKFAQAQSAAEEIARLMQPLIDCQKPDNPLLIPVPTATGRRRQRGYDQAYLLARELARSARHPYVTYTNGLARQNQARQVGASRQQRLQQLAAVFRVSKPQQVKDAAILLIDDVVTTGATLESAATVLQAAGARHIEALVFAQPAAQ